MTTPEELRKEFWENDIKSGGGILNQYLEIKRVLEENDLEWCKSKLKDIKSYAIANTEFYSHYSIDDEFPVVNKSVMIENYKAFKATCSVPEPIHISSTSGSTGMPFSVEQDAVKRKRHIADLKVFGELCDYPSHERMVCFRATIEHFHRTSEQEERENIYYIESGNLSDDCLANMVRAIIEKKPRIILAYASTIVELAKYIERVGKTKSGFSMKSVLTMSEAISEGDRKLAESVFGCTVYRRYSDMEMGILGQDMGNGSAYKLNWGSYYFEILKLDSDKPVEEGEVGRIVVTDLFNHAFPMIRYDTGDLGAFIKNGNRIELKDVFGRRVDSVYDCENNLLSPHVITNSMWGLEHIRQWQFVQTGNGEYKIVLNADKKDVDETFFIDNFKRILGQKAQISIEYVDEIPVLSSGKRKYIINEYKK